jgi:hypothetical protein
MIVFSVFRTTEKEEVVVFALHEGIKGTHNLSEDIVFRQNFETSTSGIKLRSIIIA